MRTSRLGKVAQKYQALRAMAASRVDEARKALLANVVETYLILADDEQTDLEQLVSRPESEEIREMISVYEQRGIDKGIERGIEQGLARGKRETLLRQMRHKFGDLPEAVSARVEAVFDMNELDRLLDGVLEAESIAALGFPEA
jgi:flagellar biosynthesis/type III secretory pathway protein FliH